MEGESIIPSGVGCGRPTKIIAATSSTEINKNSMDDANDALVLDDVTFLSSEEQRGHKRRLEDENTEKTPKIYNNVDNKGEVIDFEDDPDKELGDVHGEVLSPLLGEESFQGDDDGIKNSNEETVVEADGIDDNNTGDGDKIDQVETMVSPVIELPEGMALEWNDDKTSATLHISKISNNDNNNTADEGRFYNYTNRELRVCLVGRAKIKVLQGSAEVLGYNLEHDQNNMHADESESSSSSQSSSLSMGVVVTSPYWSSWMTIEANPTSLPCRIVFNCIRGHETFKVMAPKRPIVLPSSWRSCADDFVRDFYNLRATNTINTTTTAAVMVDSLEDYEDIEERKQQQDHNVRLACMITGAKGTGKSTLLRYMTNHLLSSSSNSNSPGYNNIGGVAILDTDVGQPELAPPGLLRLAIVRKPLLRPPYWNLVNGTEHEEDEEKYHTKNDRNLIGGNSDCDDDDDNDNGVEVISSVFFGATTSKVDPTRYITAVQMLMDKYETEIVQTSSDPIPLLINMDGWVKGMGYQILTALIDSLRPTHLVQILGETKSQMFDLPPTFFNSVHDEESTTKATNSPKIYQLPACQILPEASLCRISALTLRNFRWATYFLPDQLQTFDAWDFVSAKVLQTGWIVATNFDKTTTVPYWHYRLCDDKDDDDNDDDERNSEEITKEQEALNDECRLAQALAREKPYCVPMESVEVFVIGSDFEDYLRIPDGINATENDIESTRNRIFQALNGSIVSLCIDTTTMETLGYGILRSIDWNRRLLYVLVPPSVKTTPSALSRVKALVGGNLPLPLAMLYRGVYAESFPYLTTISSPPSSTILGSAPMKSRNNIARRGLIKAAAAGEAHR